MPEVRRCLCFSGAFPRPLPPAPALGAYPSHRRLPAAPATGAFPRPLPLAPAFSAYLSQAPSRGVCHWRLPVAPATGACADLWHFSNAIHREMGQGAADTSGANHRWPLNADAKQFGTLGELAWPNTITGRKKRLYK